MCAEKKRVMGEVAAWQVCAIVGAFAGESPDPRSINPYRPDVKPVEKSETQKRIENEVGWRLIQRGLFGKVIEKAGQG
jgi:hypothetical protein